MTIKDLAEMLTEQGYDIKLRKRSDGGYIISKINGVSYKGASGNIEARRVAGVQLSHARTYQLERIRPPRFKAPASRKQVQLPKEMVAKLRKIQREWRKKHKDIGGTISMRGLRYQYQQYGEEEAMASLDKAYRYSQGLAYVENVQWLIQRYEQARDKFDSNDQQWIDKIIDLLKTKMFMIKEEWIHELYYQAYYPAIVHKAISVAEAYRITNEIIQ